MKSLSFSIEPSSKTNGEQQHRADVKIAAVPSKSSCSFQNSLVFLTAVIKYSLAFLVVAMILMSLVVRVPKNKPANSSFSASVRSSVSDLQDTFDSDEEDDIYFDPQEDEANEDNDIPYEAYIDVFVRNADLSQPLLQSMDNALPQADFKKLQDCLREHPMRHSNVNDDTTFKGTKGFLLSFSEAGIKKFTQNPSFSCLETYFQTHRLPNANAWVLNMVWAEIPDYTRELAIRRHTDDAIMLNYAGSKKVMPYQTNVLYVFVPEDMIGGELEAWPYDITVEDIARGPDARVRPEENRMAFFRGDAQHQVKSYNTSSQKVLRGSLVLEQYNIPEEYQDLLVEFHWRDNQGTEMM